MMDFLNFLWYSYGGSRPRAGDALWRGRHFHLQNGSYCFPATWNEYVLQGLPGQREEAGYVRSE